MNTAGEDDLFQLELDQLRKCCSVLVLEDHCPTLGCPQLQSEEKVLATSKSKMASTIPLGWIPALSVGVSGSSIARLHMVQSAAAPLLTGTCENERMSTILASLHWLPIHFRIMFEILLFTFKFL